MVWRGGEEYSIVPPTLDSNTLIWCRVKNPKVDLFVASAQGPGFTCVDKMIVELMLEGLVPHLQWISNVSGLCLCSHAMRESKR